MASNYFSSDTIAAVATSLAGDAGVGIIRLSGARALEAAQAVSKGMESPQPRYLHRVEILDPCSQTVLDDGLGVLFAAGHSFTGEEVVELQLHGGRFLLQSVLNLLIETGKVRLALPGEFSFRSVRNGKLTLAGAEAVGQIICAKSMFEVEAARRSLSRDRIREFRELGDEIRNLLAQTELSIDFIDQDVEVISPDRMFARVQSVSGRLAEISERLLAARRIAKGLQVTLLGKPNAGKSTLFNAVLAEDRAIVSPEAGTTRDVITEELRLGPYWLRFADTAGLRAASGAIEQEGIDKAKNLALQSDLILHVVDSTEEFDAICDAFSQASSIAEKTLIVLNKWDLLDVITRRRLVEMANCADVPWICLSATSGVGIASLLSKIREILDGRLGLGLTSFLPTEFQLQMLVKAQVHLKDVLDLIKSTKLSQPELISVSLNAAVRALSDVVGETTPDSVLAKIFSEFCIGK